jgi:hypothetical protein
MLSYLRAILVSGALYGLTAFHARWRYRISDVLREMRFVLCMTDPYPCIYAHYDYVVMYVDVHRQVIKKKLSSLKQ